MQKFVTLKDNVTNRALHDVDSKRPELGYFIEHIESKPLLLISMDNSIVQLRDEEEHNWFTSRNNIIVKPLHTTVGHELTHAGR